MTEMVPIRQNFTNNTNLASDTQLSKPQKVGLRSKINHDHEYFDQI